METDMKNIYFPDEDVTSNDLYFLCYMIERVARRLHQHNQYVVNKIPEEKWRHLISVANVLHSENPQKVEDDWIEEYGLKKGSFDVTDVSKELETKVPSDLQMGKVYKRLIQDTMEPEEDYIDGMVRIYNDEICEKLDYYDCGAYYEPSYFIARACKNGGF